MPKVVLLDLKGVSSSVLLRLLHYAEVPVPTSMQQGAFSFSILDCGPSPHCEDLGFFQVSIGRIASLHSCPVQVKWKDIQHCCTPTIESSPLYKWIKTELSCVSPEKVVAIDENKKVEWYLRFHIPRRHEATFPREVRFGDQRILIRHALPFATTPASSVRPPTEETMHEHWKNTATLAPVQEKDRSNFMAHVENKFPSIQRSSLSQEILIKSRGQKFNCHFEKSTFPILFVNGVADVDDCLHTLVAAIGGKRNRGSCGQIYAEAREPQ